MCVIRSNWIVLLSVLFGLKDTHDNRDLLLFTLIETQTQGEMWVSQAETYKQELFCHQENDQQKWWHRTIQAEKGLVIRGWKKMFNQIKELQTQPSEEGNSL